MAVRRASDADADPPHEVNEHSEGTPSASWADARILSDIETIMSHRHDQGGDNWTTPDKRLIKGSPFSTLECVNYLLDLGVSADAPELGSAIRLILDVWQPDGRFKLYPKGAILPCQTAFAARTLCRAGLVDDPRVQTTLDHLLASQWEDSGWRCNRFPYGRGPETSHSNPHPTLQALDAFRFSDHLNKSRSLDASVEFLLRHWTTRSPIGPCHYGIGTQFMQVEYPFRTYNLFYWVYVLSFYDYAKRDPRFRQAGDSLRAAAADGQIVIERVVPKLAALSFCAKGKPSEQATTRYREILANIND